MTSSVTSPRSSPPVATSTKLPPALEKKKIEDTMQGIPSPTPPPKRGGGCCSTFWEAIVSVFEAIAYFFKWLFCLLEDPAKAAERIAAEVEQAEKVEKQALPHIELEKDMKPTPVQRGDDAQRELERAFPIDHEQKKALSTILDMIGTTSLVVLLFRKEELKELAQKVLSIFPMKLLAWTFRFYPHKEYLAVIRDSAFMFPRAIGGFARRVSSLYLRDSEGLFSYHIKGFCQYADIHPNLLLTAIENAQGQAIPQKRREELLSAFGAAHGEDENARAAIKELWDPVFASLSSEAWESFCEQMFNLLSDKRDESDERKKVEEFCNTLNASRLQEFCRRSGKGPEQLIKIVQEAGAKVEIDDPQMIYKKWDPLFASLNEEGRARCTASLVELLFTPKFPPYPFGK